MIYFYLEQFICDKRFSRDIIGETIVASVVSMYLHPKQQGYRKRKYLEREHQVVSTQVGATG